MKVELPDEAWDLRDSVEALVARHMKRFPLRAYWDDQVPEGESTELRRKLAELGLASTVPAGSSVSDEAIGLVQLSPVLETLGWYAVAEPVVETVGVVAPFLQRYGDQDGILERLAAGEAFATIQHGWSGHAPWAASAAYALVLDGDEVVLCAAGDAARELPAGNDLARRIGSVPQSHAIRRYDTTQAAADLASLVHTAYALTLYGLGQAVLSQAVEYAKIRTQFDRPVGSFQAVKHMLAEAWSGLEYCRRYLWYSAWNADLRMRDTTRIARTAKALAGDAAVQAGYAALQTHGGIGYTWECDLHLWLKRINAIDASFGSSNTHWALLGDDLRLRLGKSAGAGPAREPNLPAEVSAIG